MKWFGRTVWGLICEDCDRAPAPVGEPCAWCGEPIAENDDGLLIPSLPAGEHPYHFECQLRSIVGGLNHQRGKCTCCGGTLLPDPEGLTRREAARVAASYFHTRRPR